MVLSSTGQHLDFLSLVGETLPSAEYVQQLIAAGMSLADVGALRSSWELLKRVYEQEKDRLPARERVQLAVAVADLMRSDGSSERAVYLLQPLLEIVEGLGADDPAAIAYWRLHVEGYASAGAYKQAVELLDRAIAMVSAAEQKAHFRAELAEVHLLAGEHEAAVAVSAGG